MERKKKEIEIEPRRLRVGHWAIFQSLEQLHRLWKGMIPMRRGVGVSQLFILLLKSLRFIASHTHSRRCFMCLMKPPTIYLADESHSMFAQLNDTESERGRTQRVCSAVVDDVDIVSTQLKEEGILSWVMSSILVSTFILCLRRLLENNFFPFFSSSSYFSVLQIIHCAYNNVELRVCRVRT